MSDKFKPKTVQMPGLSAKKKPRKSAGGSAGGGGNSIEVGKAAKDAIKGVVDVGKDMGRGVVSEAARVVTFEGVVSQLFGQPGGAASKAEYVSGSEQAEAWKKKFSQEKLLHKQTVEVFRHKEQERKVRIQAVRQEIRVLAVGIAQWSKEVDTATFQAPVATSIYHEHFFEKLLSFIKNLKARIDSSRQWLAMHNLRSKKKGYWAQAMKGGKADLNYMFSGERAIATMMG